jgi:hypothetical protein
VFNDLPEIHFAVTFQIGRVGSPTTNWVVRNGIRWPGSGELQRTPSKNDKAVARSAVLNYHEHIIEKNPYLTLC